MSTFNGKKKSVNRVVTSLLSFFLFFVVSNCITPFEPRSRLTKLKLTVDGVISDQPGLHKVRLYYSLPATNLNFFPTQYPVDASVAIYDDLGNSERLAYSSNGYYLTENDPLNVTIGRSYYIKIELADGTIYQSIPEVLKPVVAIDTINVVYEQLPIGSSQVGQFNLSVILKDPLTIGDFYKWDWEHYELKEYCNIQSVQPAEGMPPSIVKFPCCLDKQCWAIEKCQSCITILSDKFINGKSFSQFLLSIPYESKSKYFIVINQQSLTERAYKFWSILNDQIRSSGGIFDKPPARVPGNVYNINDQTDDALGYFGASSIRPRPFYIRRDNISIPPFSVSPTGSVSATCAVCPENFFSTGKMPNGWTN